MFSKKDYLAYFQDLENIFSKDLVLLTDILNEVSDKSVYSRLYAISTDDIGIFEEIVVQKNKFED